MSELSAVMTLFGGIVIGVFFFGGLWITIRRVQHLRRPGIVLFASSVVRITIALGGLYVVAWGRWERLLIAVVGFMLARLVVIRSFGYPEMVPRKTEEVTPHGTQS